MSRLKGEEKKKKDPWQGGKCNFPCQNKLMNGESALFRTCTRYIYI
jgi:hypothetical protein